MSDVPSGTPSSALHLRRNAEGRLRITGTPPPRHTLGQAPLAELVAAGQVDGGHVSFDRVDGGSVRYRVSPSDIPGSVELELVTEEA